LGGGLLFRGKEGGLPPDRVEGKKRIASVHTGPFSIRSKEAKTISDQEGGIKTGGKKRKRKVSQCLADVSLSTTTGKRISFADRKGETGNYHVPKKEKKDRECRARGKVLALVA